MKKLVLGLVIVVTVLGLLVGCGANRKLETQANNGEYVEIDKSKFMIGGNRAINYFGTDNMIKALDNKIGNFEKYILTTSQGDDFSLYNGMTWGASVDDVMNDFGQTMVIPVVKTSNSTLQDFSNSSDLAKVNDGDLEIGYVCGKYSITLFFDKDTRGLKVVAYIFNKLA